MAEEAGESEPRTAESPDCCWLAFGLLSAYHPGQSSADKERSSSQRKATFKSPCPELVCQKFYLHFPFEGFLNKRDPIFCSAQPLSHGQPFVTPCTAACQASLSFTNSWSLLKLIKSVQPSHPLSPPSPPALNLSQHQGLVQ